jgi:hypothetical protein
MKAADIAVTVGVCLCVTGFVISSIQFLLAWASKRVYAKAKREFGLGVIEMDKFLDWLTRVVLGPKRLDHEPMYSCMASPLFLAGFLWLTGGPLPRVDIFPLPDLTQLILATSLFVGGGTCLYGISMGTPFDVARGFSRIRRRRLRLDAPPPLDLRRAYRVGASGLPSVNAPLLYYAYILLTQTPLGRTGPSVILLVFICLGMSLQGLRFLMEIRRINQTLPVLIEQEVNRRIIAAEVDNPPTDPDMLNPRQHRRWWL